MKPIDRTIERSVFYCKPLGEPCALYGHTEQFPLLPLLLPFGVLSTQHTGKVGGVELHHIKAVYCCCCLGRLGGCCCHSFAVVAVTASAAAVGGNDCSMVMEGGVVVVGGGEGEEEGGGGGEVGLRGPSASE